MTKTALSQQVPIDLKLLWVDIMEIVWVTLLSRVNHEKKGFHEYRSQDEESQQQQLESNTKVPLFYLSPKPIPVKCDVLSLRRF